MSGTSLWLVPKDSTKFSNVISQTAQRFQSPVFEAHVTLLSDRIVPSAPVDNVLETITNAVTNWKRAYSSAQELCIRFQDVRQGNMYYQCVLAAVHKDEALMTLHNELVTAFGHDPAREDPPFFPHMSLVYGDLSSDRKDEIIKTLGDDGIVRKADQNCVSIAGATGFEPAEIQLVTTKGPTSTWTVLGRVPLH